MSFGVYGLKLSRAVGLLLLGAAFVSLSGCSLFGRIEKMAEGPRGPSTEPVLARPLDPQRIAAKVGAIVVDSGDGSTAAVSKALSAGFASAADGPAGLLEYRVEHSGADQWSLLDAFMRLRREGAAIIVTVATDEQLARSRDYVSSRSLAVVLPRGEGPGWAEGEDAYYVTVPAPAPGSSEAAAIRAFGVKSIIPVMPEGSSLSEQSGNVLRQLSGFGVAVSPPVVFVEEDIRPALKALDDGIRRLGGLDGEAEKVGVLLASTEGATSFLATASAHVSAGTLPALSRARWFGGPELAGASQVLGSKAAGEFAAAVRFTAWAEEGRLHPDRAAAVWSDVSDIPGEAVSALGEARAENIYFTARLAALAARFRTDALAGKGADTTPGRAVLSASGRVGAPIAFVRAGRDGKDSQLTEFRVGTGAEGPVWVRVYPR